MIIPQRYSFNGGEEYVRIHYATLLQEVEAIVISIDASTCLLKKPKDKEINRAKRVGMTHFYSPSHLNALFDYHFFNQGWDIKPRIKTNDPSRDGYREMDFRKDRLGVEVQMGKYAFLTYDIVAKMVIFRNVGVIDCGIEICPTAAMLPYMSSGIGAFEQVAWDLEKRGAVTDFDVPVLVLGVEAEAISSDSTHPQNYDSQATVHTRRYAELPESTLRKVRETGIDA